MVKRFWIFPVVALVLILTACAPAAHAPNSAPAPQAPSLGYSQSDSRAPSGAPANGPAAAPEAPSSDQYGSSGSGVKASAVERLVIKTANLSIVVPDPVASLDQVTRMAEDMGGYVVTSNSFKTQTSDGREIPEASLTIRVPAEKLDDALAQIKKQVKDPRTDILTENVTGQDVTQQYTDLQSRLKNQQAAEQQLREIMASATKPEDVMNIFNQLTQVREQIEVLQGQIKYFEESAAMSAVNVELKAEASVAPLSIGSWQPVGVARTAVQTLIETVKFLAGAAIWLVLYILPVFLIIFIPLRLLWMGFRRLRANRKSQKIAVPPTAPTPPPAN